MNFNKPWFYYSLAALFLVCFVDLGQKYVMDRKIITNPNHLVIYLSIFVGFFGFIHFFMDKSCKSPLECDYNLILHIFILAIIGYIFNLLFTRAVKLSPDVTLPVIMLSLSIIFIYIFSSTFFQNSPHFDWSILFGILLTATGLSLIAKNFKD
mgnify:CR=1 FL=1